MKVGNVIHRLSREREDEEVVLVFDNDRSKYYIIEELPFLHAGPQEFNLKHGGTHVKSVVAIRIKEYVPPKKNPPPDHKPDEGSQFNSKS